MSILRYFLLFFDRPTEPIFMLKGDFTLFQIPDAFYPKRFQAAKDTIASRFGIKAILSIPVLNIALPNLSLPMELRFNEQFSLFIPKHRKMAGSLIDIILNIRSLQDLLSLCTFCQMNINPYMFNYALTVGILHRVDIPGLNPPSHAETFPDKFMDAKVLQRAREVSAVIPKGNRIPIVVPQNFTASDLEPEQRIAYFREDIGVNLHHWHWHLVYPTYAEDKRIVNKDRRGELFYYMHQQIIARYTAERFCNDLGRTPRFSDFKSPIDEGYFPKLGSQVASRSWPPRFAGSVMRDVDRPNDELKIDVAQLEIWRERIIQAIENMAIMLPGGKQMPLDEETGIDILGNIIESSAISFNPGYYGDLHSMGHVLIACIHDPDYRHLEPLGVMGDLATAMRDPAFYRWHSYIDDLLQLYKNKLPPYPKDKLDFSGIQVTSIGIEGRKGTNIFTTQWEQSTVDLSRGLDFAPPTGPVLASYTHLQHDDYDYVIKVKNTSNSNMMGTVRIFMAPTVDENGSPLTFNDQRRLMMELDKFTVDLPRGDKTIRQRSLDSSVTIPHDQVFRDQSVRILKPSSILDGEFDFCGCGWPHHMLIPKGTEKGYPVILFCMISNWADDRVEQNLFGKCKNAASYCGIRNSKYPDRRAMGYPFDRPAKISSLPDFLTPNMAIQECKIRYTNQTRQHPKKDSGIDILTPLLPDGSGIDLKPDIAKDVTSKLPEVVKDLTPKLPGVLKDLKPKLPEAGKGIFGIQF